MISEKWLKLKYVGMVEAQSKKKHGNDEAQLTVLYMINKIRSHCDKLEKRKGVDLLHAAKFIWYGVKLLGALANFPEKDDRKHKPKETC